MADLRISVKLLAILFLSGIFVGLLFTFFHPYRGDGTFVDYGLFQITERYRVTFEDFEFQKGKLREEYEFIGIPRKPMFLRVIANPSSDSENILEILKEHKVEVEVFLFENEKEVIHIQKSPLIGMGSSFAPDWILMTNQTFRHNDFSDVQFYKNRRYKLVL
jgi:hypothetical protein